MTIRARRVAALATVLVVVTCVGCGVALARPGGGESYSGGGGHGGSSGGGGAGAIFELLYWLLQIVIYYPAIGLPVVGLIVGYIVYSAYRQRQNQDWDSGPPVALQRSIDLGALRRIDPDFSQVVFEDFAFRLFSTAQRVRASEAARATVAPYVSPAALAALATRAPLGEAVESVVIGALRTFRVDLPNPASSADPAAPPGRVRIEIEFEANVTTAKHTYFSVESWLFGRDGARRSKPPGASKDFPCPNCGAPWQAKDTGTQVCASCGEAVDNGRFDWVVETISVASIDERPPTLTTAVPERGTDLPTYLQPTLEASWNQLRADDPLVSEAALVARLTMIYSRVNLAWSNNELAPIRGLVSDGLYDYLEYWVDAYKRQGLRNQLTDMRITETVVAKLVRDRWYDSITIRLWGVGKDFVVRGATGEVVRGSKHHDRPYSEYWTLIRSATRRGAPHPEPVCGNCGAPLAITMAGACEHCGAHLTAGEFDWVLSKVEQDDSYRG